MSRSTAGQPVDLRREVAALLGVELGPDDDDANLFELGLQSLQLMALVNRMNRAGAGVDFTEMAQDPRLRAWYGLLASREAVRVEASGAEPEPEAVASAPVDEREPFPLTPVQQAYWIGRGTDRPLGGVGCHAYLEIDTRDVVADRLERAVLALVRRHPMLRASFADDGTQRLAESATWPGLTVHDVTDLPADTAEAALVDLRERLSHRVLDVARGEVLDVQLSLRPGGAQRIHVNADLLVADVHSIRLLLSDLAALYADPAGVAELRYTFPQYIADTAAPRAARRERAREYWQRRLPELPGGPALPLAVDPGEIGVPRFVRRGATLTPQEWTALQRKAGEHGLTPAVLLVTAFSEILMRWSGQQRFLLNIPLFDRDQGLHPDIERIVADFTSLLLLDVDLSGADGFADRARAIQSRLHDDVGHAAYTGVDVLRDFVRTDTGTPRTAPVVFACNLDAPLVPDDFAAHFGELSWMVSQTPQVWLDHQVYGTREGGLSLAWDAVEALFPEGVIDTMFAAYTGLVRRLATADWNLPPDIPLPESQLRCRAEVNSVTRRESGRLLHQAFFERAADRAGEPALLWGENGRLSHGELAERALRVAGALAARGVGPGSPVVVTAPKGPDQIAAVLGILAAGGTYVPVGVDQPAERRDRIHALSRCVLVLDGTGAAPSPASEAPVLSLAEAFRAAPLDAPVGVSADETAYVIFTSGSTGTPKGVEVSHRAAVNTVEEIDERYGLGPEDRVLAVSALDFDLSVWDVFGPLAEGGALVLVDENDRRDAHRWLALCERHAVTVWNSVPALMDMLLTASDGASLPGTLRLALLSGDWIGLDLPGRLDRATDGRCRLVALGGATEAAIWSNAHDVTGVPAHWRSIPYGRPLANQRFRVVDPHGRDCPDWVPGELWIGGAGVAQGYRGDPELTRERFPCVPDGRWYRTGDQGRYWPDGTLEFLGRIDHQVKINGFRVELGEIESVLQTHPAVSHVLAAVVGDRTREIAAAFLPAPAPAPSPAATVPIDAGRGREARELEAELTETLLAALLDSLLGPGDQPVGEDALPVAEAGRRHLDSWLEFLRERQVLSRSAGTVTRGPRWTLVRDGERAAALRGRISGTCLQPVVDGWAGAIPLLTAVLAGTADIDALADDPVLSPDGLALVLPGVLACLDAVAQDVEALRTDGARTVDIAEWAGAGGRTAAALLERIKPGTVDYVLLDPRESRTQAAEARLAGSAHLVRTARQDAFAVPESRLAAFDVLVANDALGREPDPDAAARTLALLGRPAGRLFLVAREEASPLAIPTVPVPSPAADVTRWLEALERAGFSGVEVSRREPDGVALITAGCPGAERADHTADPAAIRSWLVDRLPAHMIPGSLVGLAELPLSANGKVDRRRVERALAEAAAPAEGVDDPPRGPVEEAVAELWARVLGAPVTARGAGFFALGGDSLTATRLVAAIRGRLGVELPMRDVLRAPTVAGMAALVSELRAAHGLDPHPGGDPVGAAGGPSEEFEEGEL
ncbi:non-ribosomal peptide synthetase [Streptomyces roseochromogenus]|uniref:Phenyloxazoline synthase MbtB n=1 Tax=Streptomyces roseochromogenus subsp. oscitans DS 12.976 TaxID=1352936 RepID=V6KLF2_STRRC|nr:non-ribosomal peptide synthetase [Streptomyces roseochromogenus]EST32927.1 peptide synthetase [Streptomyces roseochromogenus subsp. oscitans DS 12.976]